MVEEIYFCLEPTRGDREDDGTRPVYRNKQLKEALQSCNGGYVE
jgi:hypothetical protein